MTELEALRRVAEAARELSTRNLGRVVLGWYELERALSALDTLPAPDATGEVVEVRAHVRFDVITRERYVIEGGGKIDGTDDDPPSGRTFATIRARVPLPRVPEVVGEVG